MVLDVWDAGVWLTAAQFAGLIIGSYVIVLWAALAAWTYRDVRSRTNNQTTQGVCVALVVIFFVPGLLLYVAVRPQETLAEEYSRKIESEAFLREIQRQPVCPACRRNVQADFNSCPHCAATLRVACEACDEPVGMSWIACPCCGSAREPVAERGASPEFRRRVLQPMASASARRNGHSPRPSPVAPA